MVKTAGTTQNLRFWRIFVYSIIALLYVIPLAIIFWHGYDHYFQLFRRITGVTGITSLFIAILLSLLVRQSKQIFGIVYLKIHHYFSIAGLLLISFHPAIMAIDFGTARILIPDLSSWNSFLTNGGRSALYIIYLAVIAAILRRNIARYWRYFHALLYPAFLLGAIHGLRQGSDLKHPILLAMFIVMIAIVVIVFFYKKFLIGKKSLKMFQ